MIGLDRFGASAPAEVLAERFGFTASHVADVVRDSLAGSRALAVRATISGHDILNSRQQGACVVTCATHAALFP